MKSIRLILCIAGLFLFSTSYGQNEKFKALFMYNFTKYIEWPATQRQGEFVIGVLGNSAIVEELSIIASKQKVGSQKIVVIRCASVDEIGNCQMLYVPPTKSSLLGTILNKLSGKSTLVITDKVGMCLQGAGINFVFDVDRVKFEISKTNIEKKGLLVSNALMKLGIVVN